MHKPKKTILASALAAALCLPLAGCGSSSSDNVVNPPSPSGPNFISRLFQNPFMSPNPGSNIHNDSYLSDTYFYPGPVSANNTEVRQLNVASFVDPDSGQLRSVVLGEPAGQAYDAQGNIQGVTAGVTDPGTNVSTRSIVTLDRETMEVLAYQSFEKENSSKTDFGGAGYFYQDNQYRLVVAFPDGHVKVLRRQASELSDVDRFVADLDVNVTGPGGAVPVPNGLTALSLYALMPDKEGNIWFTIGEGIVGYITPNREVFWTDTNDLNHTGTRTPQSDGDFQEIANSHSVDEGDSPTDGSGIYILTTHKQYRFGIGPDRRPSVVWEAEYDRGTGIKPGQVSFGSGSSPTLFTMGGRRFVTIVDNAETMNCNVYRAEAQLGAGEQRLFAQVKPFGNDPQVCDENSLIVAPAPDGSGGTDIWAENNWGYTGFDAVAGSGVTRPGFARMRLLPDGQFSVGSTNLNISVPTLVSKMSEPSQTVYTYEKRPEGWYMTGLDSQNLNTVRFSVPIGPGEALYNNHYSALSVAPDGRNIWVGTALGITRVRFND